ncbi:MAG TPA: hypothetical protein VJY41_03785 [Prolixibacteraceae bacterium]|nr:hypothetical protein [Prolixibacteraceae bacterium]
MQLLVSQNHDFFPAKILLFGEYGIVAGGSGLAIPYSKYGGRLRLSNQILGDEKAVQSHESIQYFFHFLKKNESDYSFLDLSRFEVDLKNGLWFDSDIPSSYGLGSSGALVAAVYSKYRTDNSCDLLMVKKRLAIIESHFHGSSSGIDPAVSFFQQTTLFHGLNQAKLLPTWSLNQTGLSVYLVDTGVKSKTMNLVEWFKVQMQKPEFSRYAKADFFNVNQKIADSVSQSGQIIFDDVLAVSHYQIDYFTPMIPEIFRKHFFAGLENRNFAFKLCGSGGGGFMLCFSESDSVEDYLNLNGLMFEKLC